MAFVHEKICVLLREQIISCKSAIPKNEITLYIPFQPVPFHVLNKLSLYELVGFWLSSLCLLVYPLKRQSGPQQTTFINILSLFFREIRLDVSSGSSARQRIHMKNQVLFSSKDKSKKLKCRLLHFLFGALRVKLVYQNVVIVAISNDVCSNFYCFLPLQ